MNERISEYLARRMEGTRNNYNRNDDQYDEIESRRRRRSDGTFMRGTNNEIEYDTQGERNTDNRYENRHEQTNAHKGPDDDRRRRIGFGSGQSKEKSHWSEEEFVGDMEESLYHEVDDIFHYLDIMEKVYDKGYDELASAFYEIANEKFICAEYLKTHLKKIGKYDKVEHRQLEEDLNKVRKMFK